MKRRPLDPAFHHDGRVRAQWMRPEQWREDQLDDEYNRMMATHIAAVLVSRNPMWTADRYIRAAFPPRLIVADGSARHMTRREYRFGR